MILWIGLVPQPHGEKPASAEVRLKTSQIRAYLPAVGHSIWPMPGSGWLCAIHPLIAPDFHVPRMLFHP
jgi:hypothetical protein